MSEFSSNNCPECDNGESNGLDRRRFMRAMGGIAAATGCVSVVGGRASAAPEKKEKPAEGLIKELLGTLSDEQRMNLVHPWDHGADGEGGQPTRLRTFNSPVLGKRIGENYSKPQQELVRTILKSILSGDDAYERLTRHGKWDGAGSFEGNSAVIFGDPAAGKFSWVFGGHHLTVRCDGNSEPGAAFGGPMYYGHSAHGYSDQNVYNYQTKQVLSVFDALDEKQRAAAVLAASPGDRASALRTREPASRGVGYAGLSGDQKKLIEGVMHTLLEPFRKEDGDEVMELVKANGGMEKVHLGFYKENAEDENERWQYWRLEGPGFIWNYRVLPHVHCYVNIVNEDLAKS